MHLFQLPKEPIKEKNISVATTTDTELNPRVINNEEALGLWWEGLSEKDKQRFIFLENHPEIRNYWLVNSYDPAYKKNLGDLVGQKRHLSPFRYPEFLRKAQEEGYEIIFLDDPAPIFDWLANLNSLPEIEINSSFPGTIRGLLSFQVQGYNFLRDLKGGIAHWDTGSGKTVLSAALMKYHQTHHDIDLALWVVKAHNKINTKRALEALLNTSAIVIDGSKDKRQKLYESIRTDLRAPGAQPAVVLNYEKFRDDQEEIESLVEGRRVFIVWDEMPVKLKNRETQLYQAVCKTLFTSRNGSYYPSKKIRPKELYQVMLSATPVDNDPENWFNAVRIIDSSIYGSVKKFHSMFVAHRNPWTHKPDGWRNLQFMGALASHITHQVDKTDHDIAALFPKIIPETIYLSLDENSQKLYDLLYEQYLMAKYGDRLATLSPTDIMGIITVFQLLCDNPRGVLESAKRFERDEGGSKIAHFLWELTKRDDSMFSDMKKGELINSKLIALKDRLDAADDKTLIFTRWNSLGIPFISEWLDKWGYGHVQYHSKLSSKARQEAQDRFVSDPKVRVFLSSDSGSDSINLEVANESINYDLPDKWTTLIQRPNRINRITSGFTYSRYTTLVTVGTIEDRIQELLDKKYNYHKQILKGEISEQSNFLRGRSELIYILTGKE